MRCWAPGPTSCSASGLSPGAGEDPRKVLSSAPRAPLGDAIPDSVGSAGAQGERERRSRARWVGQPKAAWPWHQQA